MASRRPLAPVLRGARLLVAALAALVVVSGLAVTAPRADAAGAPAKSFVQRTGSTLTLDGAPFRFSGTNIYWLGLDDNVRDAAGAPTYPSKFRVEDAFRAAQASGGTVVRTWGGLVGCARCIQPAPGVFQAGAFDSLDFAVATAARYRQRLIITLVDNWDYYHGNKSTFSSWRGLPESAFFSDPTVIADYQAYISHVVSHVNPYTGLRYADDPTIMGWQTGNEMWCQTCAGNFWDGSWTRAVADHIERVAPRQLVVDGHGTDPACRTDCLHEPSLDIASVDIVDDHFYPMQLDRVRSSAATALRHGKAYLVGEYAWNGAQGGEPLAAFLDAVRTSGAAGALTWSVVPHHDTAGFVDHDDGYQYFFPGRTADERARTTTLQAFARAMGAPEPPRWAVPPTPCGLSVSRTATGHALSWRGASPAVAYVVQRLDRSTPGATWQDVTWHATDQRVARGPLFTDTSVTARLSPVLAYRVAGLSATRVLGAWSAGADTGTRTACAG
ncbi:hypothetical protein GTR02_17680 [Kineococcus sp. R8]|uniref:hypothetical protein n=1 Tax=Kineococcus siccus TaxID=2696567 RepID=UPI0014126BA9|nr:hypothetical protein [Kineococcus siccus]NAZ83646.1 hypothetical protein [Kineococcus siccus]